MSKRLPDSGAEGEGEKARPVAQTAHKHAEGGGLARLGKEQLAGCV